MPRARPSRNGAGWCAATGRYEFTYFTGTKVQMLTAGVQWRRLVRGHCQVRIYLLYWYKSANADSGEAAALAASGESRCVCVYSVY
jgi:hypothetical protein